MRASVGKPASDRASIGKGSFPFAKVLLACAILSSAGCGGLTGVSANNPNQNGSPAPAIALSPASVSFGTVAVGGVASQSVTIANSGSANLSVTQASTTVNGVAITGISLPLSLAPGKQSAFNVVFSPKSAGGVSGVVSVLSDTSGSPSSVSVSGMGVAATALLDAAPSTLNFGSVSLGASGTLSSTLTNAGNSDVTVSNVSVSGTRYSVTGVSSGLILAPGQTAPLQVTFSPLTSGNFSASLAVASNATNSPATILLSGTGAQPAPHSVTLTWSPSTSIVSGYLLYRSTVSGGPYGALGASLVVGNSYVDTAVQSGQTYYYVARAVGPTGLLSVDSAQASTTVP